MDNIARTIKQMRQQAGNITQSDLASAIGFKNRANVSKLESGRLEWKFRDVVKALGFLGYEIVIKKKDVE